MINKQGTSSDAPVRSFSPKASAIGSLGACFMFLITLSFALTTPGVWQTGYGFPFASPMPGQFIAKDLLLLGAAVWTAGEALRAAHRTKDGSRHEALNLLQPLSETPFQGLSLPAAQARGLDH